MDVSVNVEGRRMVEIIKSTCGNCQMACGILINLEDNKPIKIEGDPIVGNNPKGAKSNKGGSP